MTRLLLTPLILLHLLGCDRPPRVQAAVNNARPATVQAAVPRFRQLPPAAALADLRLFHLADLSGDGVLDVVAIPPGSETPAQSSLVRSALGDGRGGFSSEAEAAVPLAGVTCIASGDFDDDGNADLALGWHDSYDACLLRGDGAGGFAGAPRLLPIAAGASPHMHSLVSADLNANGHSDLLATCADDNAVAVQLGDGRGGFTPAPGSPFPAGVHPYDHLTIADMEGDGHQDVVVANLHGNTVSVLRGDGTGALTQMEGSPLPAGPRPGFATVGDLDNDGHLDIVATHDDDPLLAVYYGDGCGGFSAAAGSPLRLPGRLWDVDVVDLDGDGASELVGAETLAADGAVLVFPGGRYADALPEPARIEVEGGELHRAQPADLNGDGRLDLLVGLWDAASAVVLVQE